ncbi:unnamed protein product [Effrenium voratum]|uniref:S1 motif domain-containing protein n=1 Tax=Effrenium voratum TaxID=2562239 RepID=A0AA36N803_9DINO|nr:unnamed protein product [Effrenium voratum]CAJ1433776.1 unnamed protein product [Effrenium voratum]
MLVVFTFFALLCRCASQSPFGRRAQGAGVGWNSQMDFASGFRPNYVPEPRQWEHRPWHQHMVQPSEPHPMAGFQAPAPAPAWPHGAGQGAAGARVEWPKPVPEQPGMPLGTAGHQERDHPAQGSSVTWVATAIAVGGALALGFNQWEGRVLDTAKQLWAHALALHEAFSANKPENRAELNRPSVELVKMEAPAPVKPEQVAEGPEEVACEEKRQASEKDEDEVEMDMWDPPQLPPASQKAEAMEPDGDAPAREIVEARQPAEPKTEEPKRAHRQWRGRGKANDAQPQGQPEPQSQPEPIDWLNDRGEHSFLEPSPDMKPPSPGSMKKLQKARLAQKALEIEALVEDWSWGAGEPKAANDGCIYFAGGPPKQSEKAAAPKAAKRTWRAGGAGGAGGSVASSRAMSAEEDELLDLDVKLEEDGKFVLARPLRFRPLGCNVRLPGSRDAFLPVEHITPWTEASTNAVRKTVTKAAEQNKGRIRVREIGGNNVSMLKPNDEAMRGQELEARRRKLEAGIAKLRDSFNPGKWLVGMVSSVQSNGIFVSVIDGQDALIPTKEIPPKLLQADEAEKKPALDVGQAVSFRIIRYSWQSDGFTGSMLPLPTRQERPRQGGFEEQEVERPPTPDNSESAKRWAEKGYSVITSEAALELNQWLRSKMEDKKSKKSSKALVKASGLKYLVNVMRGMNTKAVGNVEVEKNVSEKEVKQAAVELLLAEGHLKAGEQHKGITISKNTISVKL